MDSLMRYLLLAGLLVVPGLCIQQRNADRDIDICALPKDPGPGDQDLPRFYFNCKTQQCESFLFGGIGGNKNNFIRWDDCNRTCKQTAICRLPRDPGSCGWYRHIRYYYIPRMRTCSMFFYTGSRGNKNNFRTFQSCIDRCRDIAPCPPSTIHGNFQK